LGGRDQENPDSKSVLSKKTRKYPTQNIAGVLAQVLESLSSKHEFKPQYQQKKKKEIQ
jgi:hypothetical protein